MPSVKNVPIIIVLAILIILLFQATYNPLFSPFLYVEKKVIYLILGLLSIFIGYIIFRSSSFFNVVLNLTGLDILFYLIIGFAIVAVIRNDVTIIFFSECLLFLLWFTYTKWLPSNSIWLYYLLFPYCAFSQIVLSYYNLTEPWHSFSHIRGVFTNSSVLGGYIAICSIILILFLINQIKQYKATTIKNCIIIFNLFILSILLFQLFIGNSRAGWLAFVGGLIAVLFNEIQSVKIFEKIPLYVKKGLLLFSLICMVLLFFQLYNQKKESADGRLLIWRVSVEMIKDKPIIGHGIGGFHKNYMNYQAEYFKNHPNSSFKMLAGDNNYVFNEYLNVVISYGIIGVLIIIFFFYLLFFRSSGEDVKDKKKSEKNRIYCILIPLIIFSLFSYPSRFIQFNLLTIFLLARFSLYLPIVLKLNADFNLKQIYSKILKGFLLFFYSLLCIITIYSLNRFLTTTELWYSLFDGKARKKTEIVNLYKEMYPVLKEESLFLYMYGIELRNNGDLKQAKEVLIRSSDLHSKYTTSLELAKCYQMSAESDQAELLLVNSSYMIPSRFQPLYELMKINYECGDIKKAKEYAETIVNKQEKVISPKVYSMRLEAKKILEQ